MYHKNQLSIKAMLLYIKGLFPFIIPAYQFH